MISVQSHRQLLNGSRLLVLLLLLFSVACSGSKKTVKTTTRKTTKIKPRTTTAKKKEVKKDTRSWAEEKKKEEKENKVEKEDPKKNKQSYKKDIYNVAMFIPFDVKSSSSQISAISNKFLNYYGGVQLALAELERQGVQLNIRVYDSKSDFESKLNDPFNESADVLIGPYDTGRLKKIAQFGKENNIPVISPWKASKRIAKNNPNYIQLSPNPSDHFKKIIDHVNQSFSPDQVFLLKRVNNKKDETLSKVIQKYHRTEHQQQAFNEFEINVDSLQFGDNAYDSLFLVNRPTVFILPNYTSKDETYIYNAVRRISTERGFNQVYVYGMPILLSSNKFTYDYYKNLNLRICSSKLVERNNEVIKDFERAFYARFQSLPSDDAFEGFDMMMFVGSNLFEKGLNFQESIVGDEQQLLQTIYNLKAISAKEVGKDQSETEYYQNIHLDIIQYQGDDFKRL